MKAGRRPGRIYYVMHATADVTFSLLTSGFVLSPSLFFPWIQLVPSVQYVLRVWLLLDRSWLAIVRDISSSTHHVINPSRSSPHFSYCKQQKLGVEAWEWGYSISIDAYSSSTCTLYMYYGTCTYNNSHFVPATINCTLFQHGVHADCYRYRVYVCMTLRKTSSHLTLLTTNDEYTHHEI